LTFALTLLAACSPTPEAPRVDAVVPNWGWRGEETDIRVSGEAFFPDVQVRGFQEDDGRVDASFRLWLEGPDVRELSRVDLVDYTTLTGTVPEGLPVGTWDLRVVTPAGLEATLPDAFSVTDTRADHLSITVDDAAFDANSAAALHLRLEDPDHQVVAQALPVEVRATSALDAAGVAFSVGLDGAVPLSDGVGVRGQLDDDGTATLLVSSSLPDDVTFTLSAVDSPVITPAAVLVSWEAGALDSVDIELPSDPFTAVAGVPFDVDLVLRDQFGNPLGPQPLELLLYEECAGAFQQEIDLSEPGPWSITLTGACEVNSLHTLGLGLADGVSETFEVRPADAAGLRVGAYPNEVVAGTGLLLVEVEAVDPWGNLVEDVAGSVVLTDSAGGLDPLRGVGQQSCGAFEGGRLVCTATPMISGSAVTLRAETTQGLSGVSDPVEVVPDAPVEVRLSAGVGTIIAGDPFDLDVEVSDAWGNAVPYDPSGGDPVEFSDDTGTLSCAVAEPTARGHAFVCTVTFATTSTELRARVLGLEGRSDDALPVLNGDLDEVELTIFVGSLTAGEPFTLQLAGFDAWGNPYTFPTSGGTVDLADTTGSLSPASATFDSDGITSIAATLTVAGDELEITAAQGGVTLGTLSPVDVLPGPLEALTVEIDPWIDVADPGVVEVVAVDAWENPIGTYGGTVTLTSATGLCDTMEVSGFVAGRAATELVCPDVGFAEHLEASDSGGISGTSEDFDVLDFACENGPTADLLLEGTDEPTLCLVGGRAVVDADAAASVSGSSPVIVWHLLDEEGTHYRSSDPTQSFTYTAPGAHRIRTAVVDGEACADELSGVAYVAANDGSAAGPLSVSTSSSSAAVGASVLVSVSALDCAGDVAGDATLSVRADLGVPDATETGEGLELTLDASGLASFDWSFPEGYSGDATLHLAPTGGGGYGSAAVTVSGDTVRPQIVESSPAGGWDGEVDTFEVVFTDPMRSLSVVAPYFTLTGPDGTVDLAVTLSVDLTTATLVPDSTVDADSGAWSLVVSDQVRDTAGNRLSGDWSGGASSATIRFGAVDDELPTGLSCTADRGRFQPDGDDGADEHADSVQLTTSASTPPAWWRLTVSDGDGLRVRTLRVPGTDGTVSWDGRADDGRVVEAGAWRLRLHAVDVQENAGLACSITVGLEQEVAAP